MAQSDTESHGYHDTTQNFGSHLNGKSYGILIGKKHVKGFLYAITHAVVLC